MVEIAGGTKWLQSHNYKGLIKSRNAYKQHSLMVNSSV
jgi:hypothetical protein